LLNFKMLSVFPPSINEKILKIIMGSHTFAYMKVDEKGEVIDRGGDFESMGLPTWSIGADISDSAFFLSGMLPMISDYEYLPSIHISDADVIDVHLFLENDLAWVIMQDRSDDLEWQILARQKSNELRLLEHKVQALNVVHEPTPEISLVFQALNMVAMLKKDNDCFELLKPAAPVFSIFYPELFEDSALVFPQRRFPFIENFLVDAQVLWDSKENGRRIRSGPWVDTTLDGDEVALEAVALNWEEHSLLLIEVLEENYQLQHRTLQIGREGKLAKDFLAREVSKQTQQILEREEEIALRLVWAAETRDDGETGSHIRRLGLYSELMAKHLGWEQCMVDAIRIAASMHDIGKIGIPDYILKKAGGLTNAEFEIMKRHSEIGAQILSNSNSELIQMARDIALGHHERWDGKGYPYGQSGSQIAISARIVAIVDVFDALIHKRVYKSAMSVDKAIDIMREERGKQFDPELFDLFIKLREEMEVIAKNFVSPLFGGIG